jgi:hypothetical protein
VEGHIAATYDSLTGIVDVGHSALRLPSSRAEISGAIGRKLQVHLETRDFNDILPALGASASSVPLKLENGSAAFDGTVTGPPDDLHIQGHAAATRLSYEGQLIESLASDVTASSENVKAQNVSVTRGGLRVQGEMEVALRQWKTGPGSLIFGKGTVHGADMKELASLAGLADQPVSGTLDATAEVSGSIGNPLVNADIDLRQAIYRREPVDHLAAHVRYSSSRVEVASSQVTAGGKQVSLAGAFDHAADRWDTGRLLFRVTTNAMPVEQIHALEGQRNRGPGSAQGGRAGLARARSSRGSGGTRSATDRAADRRRPLDGQFASRRIAGPRGIGIRGVDDPRRRRVASGGRVPGQRHHCVFEIEFRGPAGLGGAFEDRRP